MAGETLPWDQAWAVLVSKGWRIELGARGDSKQSYYLPPGISREPPFRNRVDYFDSKTMVLRQLPGLLAKEKQEARRKNLPRRGLLAMQSPSPSKKKQESDALESEVTPPPIRGRTRQSPSEGKRSQPKDVMKRPACAKSQDVIQSARAKDVLMQSLGCVKRSLSLDAIQSPAPAKDVLMQSPAPVKRSLAQELMQSPARPQRSVSQDVMQSSACAQSSVSPNVMQSPARAKGQQQDVIQSPARARGSMQDAVAQSPSQSTRPVQQHQKSEKDPTPSPSKRQQCTTEQVSSPKRARAAPCALTPSRLGHKEAKIAGAAPRALTPSRLGHEEEDNDDEYFAVLPGLFFGLESVLCLLAARNLKAYHSTVLADVGSIAGRDLNESRLSRVLALVPGMIDVRWVGSGINAKLELFQCAEDGTERAPTADEQSKRKAAFNAALMAAKKGGTIPRRVLPPRPQAPIVVKQVQSESGISMPETIAAKPAVKGLSASARRENLLKRVQAREAAGDSVETQEYQELCRRANVCDNAMRAHSVLQSLFARGEGKHSAATEAEVIKAMTSASYGMQSRRTLNKPDAIEAVQFLASRAGSWFFVEAGVHFPDAKYFRRLPTGSASLALAALTTERQDLDTQTRAVCEMAKQREQQIQSQHLLNDEGVGSSGDRCRIEHESVDRDPIAERLAKMARPLKPSGAESDTSKSPQLYDEFGVGRAATRRMSPVTTPAPVTPDVVHASAASSPSSEDEVLKALFDEVTGEHSTKASATPQDQQEQELLQVFASTGKQEEQQRASVQPPAPARQVGANREEPKVSQQPPAPPASIGAKVVEQQQQKQQKKEEEEEKQQQPPAAPASSGALDVKVVAAEASKKVVDEKKKKNKLMLKLPKGWTVGKKIRADGTKDTQFTSPDGLTKLDRLPKVLAFIAARNKSKKAK